MAQQRILEYLHRRGSSGRGPGRIGRGLAACCAERIGVTAAAVVLMIDGDYWVCLSASDPAMATIEDLQFALGEGPGIDAGRSQLAVIEADLRRHEPARWPLFSR